MRFLKRVLLSMLLHMVLAFVSLWLLTLSANIGFSGSGLFLVFFILILVATFLYADFAYKKGLPNIWHLPISQVALCLVVCLFLLFRDLLGFRESSALFDFGVFFDIILVAIFAGFWIVPSGLISLIYWKADRTWEEGSKNDALK